MSLIEGYLMEVIYKRREMEKGDLQQLSNPFPIINHHAKIVIHFQVIYYP